MNFPREAVRACDELYARNTALAHSADDNDRRTLTRMIGGQIAFALGPRWGCKKRHGLSDADQSKDSIAYREDDGTVSVWDWQNGTTRKRAVEEGADPNYPHLSPDEADFMPVTPTNHLGWGTGVNPPIEPQKPPIPPVTPPEGGDQKLESFIQDVRASLGRIERQLAAPVVLPPSPPVMNAPPNYEGTVDIRYLGTGKVSLKPVP